MRSGSGGWRGAHGLRILGLDASAHRLAAVPAGFPLLEVVRDARVLTGPPVEAVDGHVRLLPGHADIGIPGRGAIVVEEARGLATFSMQELPSDEEVLHPYLAAIAAIRARWSGHDAFHAGAFVVDGRAWGVLGRRRSGKSTLLSWLAAQSVPVVSDDLLVVEPSLAVFAGPRFVDLRRQAAEHLEAGEPLGRVGARARWRLQLPSIESTVPLGGWIVLAWSRSAGALEAVPPALRVRLLAEALAIGAPPSNAASLLRLAALPMHEFARPRDWDSLSESCALLIEGLRAR